MRVLVAFECSGKVRDAFRNIDHEAYSCDLKLSGGPYHIQGNALDIIPQGWDLVIAHPPCTHLAVSGARHFEEKRKNGLQLQGISLFMSVVEACTKLGSPWAIENPVGIMSSCYRKPDQIIQPYEFGDAATKTTCLWLDNLPKLIPTRRAGRGEIITLSSGRRMSKWYSSASAQERSVTFSGIANAMAAQWGNL